MTFLVQKGPADSRTLLAVPLNSKVVDDPLCVGGTGRGGNDWKGTGCRGKVLQMKDCVGEGERHAFSHVLTDADAG